MDEQRSAVVVELTLRTGSPARLPRTWHIFMLLTPCYLLALALAFTCPCPSSHLPTLAITLHLAM
jgi:hypothetical protein